MNCTFRTALTLASSALLVLGTAGCNLTSDRRAKPERPSIEGLWLVELTGEQQQARARDEAEFSSSPGPETRESMLNWHHLESMRLHIGAQTLTTAFAKVAPAPHDYQVEVADGRLLLHISSGDHIEEKYTLRLNDDQTMDWIDPAGTVHRWKRGRSAN